MENESEVLGYKVSIYFLCNLINYVIKEQCYNQIETRIVHRVLSGYFLKLLENNTGAFSSPL